MNKLTLQSGTYAIDDILIGFDIIEKPSSNVAFVGRDFVEHRIYVQFKNGSAYMYSDVDYDTLSAIPVAESIGKFVSSCVVKKFPSEKMEKALVIKALDPLYTEEDYQNHKRDIDLINASMKHHGKSIFDDVDEPTS